MKKDFTDNKIVITCPRCGNVLLRTGDADIEVFCHYPKCRERWNISIKGWNIEYKHLDENNKSA